MEWRRELDVLLLLFGLFMICVQWVLDYRVFR